MKEKLDLVLIKPGGRLGLFGKLAPSLSGFAPPLDIGLLASFVRNKGYNVRIIDADAEFLTPDEVTDKVVEYSPVVAGVFAHTIRVIHAGHAVREIKKRAPHIKTLLGGRHPTALPEKTLFEEGPDFVCQGEVFYPVVEFLERLRQDENASARGISGFWYLEEGKAVSNPPHALIQDLDELPLIAWDLLPMDKYKAHNWHCFDDLGKRQPYAIIYTSMGCPYHCHYCCVNTVYGGSSIRYRSPEKVMEEIDLLVKNYNVRNIRMVDDIFNFKRDRVMRLCDLIIERGYDLNIWCYTRIDLVTEEMLEKMKRAGFNWICYGIEAGNQKVREGVSKNLTMDRITKGIEMVRKSGVYSLVNFVFGLPEDNLDTMQESLDMAKDFNFEYVNFYAAMAWPGSKLYEESVRNNVRLPEQWSGYAQLAEDTLCLPTKHISAPEVLRFRDNAFVDYFSNPRYIEMLGQRFGPEVVGHINGMLQHKINRKFA